MSSMQWRVSATTTSTAFWGQFGRTCPRKHKQINWNNAVSGTHSRSI